MLKPLPLTGWGERGLMKTTNEYREQLADSFIKALDENGLQWKKGWMGTEAPKSAVSGATYKGINRFMLAMATLQNGYEDNRWATFKQIQNEGWKLEKGAKGVQIEFWVPLDPETNKPTTWAKIDEIRKENPDVKIKGVPQYHYVFNGDKIKGIPERQVIRNQEIKIENIVPKISQNMGVEILNDGGNRAFYRPSEDKIHLPKPEQFLSSYDYYATAMHELAHASGAESRLNRDLTGKFGTSTYAFEELVAEMSSAFMSEHLPYELPAEQLDTHKAYLQHWANAIKENPDYLIQAIKKADICANYLEEMGEIHQELQKELQQDKAVVNEIDYGSMTMEQRYTEALKIAGYEIIPTPEGSPATVTIKNIETGHEMGSDGWGGIAEHLESIEIQDATLREQYNNLIHPDVEIIYYTTINQETIKHPNFETALKTYLDADLQYGKNIGVSIEGTNHDLAYTTYYNNYNNPDNDEKYIRGYVVTDKSLMESPYLEDFNKRVSAELSYQDFNEIKENINTLNQSLGQDMAYADVMRGYDAVRSEALDYYLSIGELSSPTYFVRIANDSRPQDYVQFEIIGSKSTRDITATLTSVHANEVVDLKQLEVKLADGDFDSASVRAFEEIDNYFTKDNCYLREATNNLATDYDKSFTIYYPWYGTMEQHYQALADRGYEQFPNYEKINQTLSEQVDISLNNDVQQNVPEHREPEVLTEKKQN